MQHQLSQTERSGRAVCVGFGRESVSAVISLSAEEMPKNEKKVKAVKSHFSYETRKDVDLAALSSLKLEKSWPFIRAEIEKEVGQGRLTCVPYLTEASCYQLSTVLLPCAADDEGPNNTRQGMKPIGKLATLVDKNRSDPKYVSWLNENSFVDESFKFPHESVKITLQDEEANNKVRVIMFNFFRMTIDKSKSPVNKIYLKLDAGLKGVKSVYVITDVLMAKTVEFRANTGISSRIFHVGNPTPLVFCLDKFDVNEDGLLISQTPTVYKSDYISWCKVDAQDNLYTTPPHPSPVKT